MQLVGLFRIKHFAIGGFFELAFAVGEFLLVGVEKKTASF